LAVSKDNTYDLVNKLRGHNIRFAEPTSDGRLNNYFQSSQKESHNFKKDAYSNRGNQNTQAQIEDSRKSHFKYGFDNSTYNKSALNLGLPQLNQGLRPVTVANSGNKLSVLKP
jgi:hypothetical protein